MNILHEYRNANGQLHRVDGPAIECANGDKEWWINGIEIDNPKWLKTKSANN